MEDIEDGLTYETAIVPDIASSAGLQDGYESIRISPVLYLPNLSTIL